MPNVAATVKAGLARSAVQQVQAIDRLTAFRWRVGDALAGFDIIATPASPSRAWPKREPFPAEINGQATTGKSASVFSTAINCAGLAALVLPMPVAPGGCRLGCNWWPRACPKRRCWIWARPLSGPRHGLGWRPTDAFCGIRD